MSTSLKTLQAAIPSTPTGQLKALASEVICTPEDLIATTLHYIGDSSTDTSYIGVELMVGIALRLLTKESDQRHFKEKFLKGTALAGKYQLWKLADELPFPLPNQYDISGMDSGATWWNEYAACIVTGGSLAIWQAATAESSVWKTLPSNTRINHGAEDFPALFKIARERNDPTMARQLVHDAPFGMENEKFLLGIPPLSAARIAA